jgi:hypothetical protein
MRACFIAASPTIYASVSMHKYTKIGATFGIGLAITAAVGIVGVFEHNTALSVPHNGIAT